ncbi:cytochrome P450 [Ceratobasidium sp. AG-I]|nr:cytochrome P450 [Ceratobasidium sp. AG-I]
MPRNDEPAAYAAMSKELNSDIIALNILGQIIVVLNSMEVAAELMDKRSSISRVELGSQLWQIRTCWTGGEASSNSTLTKDGRGADACCTIPWYYPNQEKLVRIMLSRLVDSPPTLERFAEELNFAIGSGLIYATYGYDPQSPQDKWLKAAQLEVEHAIHAAQPASFLVNFIPALKYLPGWLPGMGWKQLINEWRLHKEYTTSSPYKWTKEQIRTGNAVPSIVQKILSSFPESTPSPDEDLYIELTAATLFAGGTDTTVSSGMYFILAMVRHPEVALKIQAELDSVLGNAERLPSVEDREHMPYLRNTMAELLRWQPVSPLGVPHATTDDDYYKGYYIPKGSFVAATRDTSVYPDPERFNPDRFLDPQVPTPTAFGFGRRVCPGVLFAESNLFLLISSLMYVFDIRRARDESGNEIIPEVIISPEPTIVSKPMPFKFNMKPRSEAHKTLVMHNAHGL